MPVRLIGSVVSLRSWVLPVGASALLVMLLYCQFYRHTPPWLGPAIGGALAVSFLWPGTVRRWRWQRAEPARRERVSRAVQVVAFDAARLFLCAAIAFYTLVRPDEFRLDLVLAGAAVAVLCARLLGWAGLRFGNDARPVPRGQALARLVRRAAVFVAAAVCARFLVYGVAVGAFWVPVRALHAARAWNIVVLVIAMAVCWSLWAVIFGVGSGILQIHEHRWSRRTQGWGDGSYWHEDSWTEDHSPEHLRSGLGSLLRFHYRTSYSQTSSSGGGSFSYSTSSSITTGTTTEYLAVFPPEFAPFWLDLPNRGLKALVARRATRVAARTRAADPAPAPAITAPTEAVSTGAVPIEAVAIEAASTEAAAEEPGPVDEAEA
ncbi:hypothetical protein [Pseudofrankia inefficax]|nr:hypothetical protein [Pseudofrankia inefficax]